MGLNQSTPQFSLAHRPVLVVTTVWQTRQRSGVEPLRQSPQSRRRRLFARHLVLLVGTLLTGFSSHAAKVVVIRDSLSAEYDAIPDAPGTENPTVSMPTARPQVFLPLPVTIIPP